MAAAGPRVGCTCRAADGRGRWRCRWLGWQQWPRPGAGTGARQQVWGARHRPAQEEPHSATQERAFSSHTHTHTLLETKRNNRGPILTLDKRLCRNSRDSSQSHGTHRSVTLLLTEVTEGHKQAALTQHKPQSASQQSAVAATREAGVCSTVTAD